jgi:carbon-monoxide dehydrogenase large subunit
MTGAAPLRTRDPLVGASVKRLEDPALLAGKGRFADDVSLPGMLHAAFVRSPHPHARIVAVDTSAAARQPGVAAVLTGDDMAALLTGPMTVASPLPDGRVQTVTPLATGKVRFVGDPVAVVLAASRYDAEDAADAVDVTYEPLAAVASASGALAGDAPRVFDEWDDNVVGRLVKQYGDTAGAFARADRVVTETYRTHRYASAPMEGRAIVAVPDPGSGDLLAHVSTQIPHWFRVLVAPLLGLPVGSLHVAPLDIGGSFGQKFAAGREEIAVLAAARRLGRPVKWIEDRNENLTAAGQARDETVEVEAAVDRDGRILAVKVRCVVDQGAYSGFPLPVALFLIELCALLPNCYRIAHFDFDGTIVSTNKASYTAYRGPWATETWVRERLLDRIAAECGLDRVEVRRRNLVAPDELPGKLVTGGTLDLSVLPLLDRAATQAGWDGFPTEREEARARGRHLGIGLCAMIEPGGGPPDLLDTILPGMGAVTDCARVRLEGDGSVSVFVGQSPTGQSHRTTLAQVAADELGVDVSAVRVRTGDTRSTPYSLFGTGGSRAASIAGGAVAAAAAEVRRRLLAKAAVLLEANPADLELAGVSVQVKGTPEAAVPVAMVTQIAYQAPFMMPPDAADSLDVTADFPAGGAGHWTGAVHWCVVDVDLDTGLVAVVRYGVVEDCGRPINPAVVDGQITGGVAQGVGAVLLERSAYDESGQYLAGTFLDYLLPTTLDVPRLTIDHVVGDTANRVNIRGVGEGGLIASPAALSSAIEDALSPFGGRVTEQHLPPTRILELAGRLPNDASESAR